MDLGFSGEVAEFYHRYRHGYPAAVIDALVGAFELSARDIVVDLGCGTGQLTLPIAGRVRAAVGVDPEPDMLLRARRAARDLDVPNVAWLIGGDDDVPALAALLGGQSVAAVTIGQALHWMNDEALFRAVIPLLRARGGVAVVTNGTPLWLQDTDWSRAVRACLEKWLGTRPAAACGTDEQSQLRYQAHLAAAGFEVLSTAVDHDVDLTLDQIVGGIYSALPVRLLPSPADRPAFAERIRDALRPHEHVTEHVHVAILAGRLP
jgi:SAM-dependent methyltransferase